MLLINNKTVQRRQKSRAIGKTNQLTRALCSNLQPMSSPPYCSNPSLHKRQQNLFIHTSVYIVCSKAKAIMFSKKLEITYNSTRNGGKSRPQILPLHKNGNKLGDLTSFLIAQSSQRTLQILAAQANQPKQKRVPHLCLVSPTKFHRICHTKIITLPVLGFSSHLFQCPPYFQFLFYTLKYLQTHELFNFKKRGKGILKYFFFTINTQMKNTEIQYKNNEKQLQTTHLRKRQT